MSFRGRMVKALALARTAIARVPTDGAAHSLAGWTSFQLGAFEDAVASFQKAVELENQPNWHSDLLVARYYTGLASKEELTRALAITVVPEHQLSYAQALADCPDPDRRDPRTAITTVTDPALSVLYPPAGSLIEVLARVRLEDWQGAHEALQRFVPSGDILVVTPQAVPFLRALIHQKLGHAEAARECLARGLEDWTQLVGDDQEAWQDSDVRRWRTAAEAAMGR